MQQVTCSSSGPVGPSGADMSATGATGDATGTSSTGATKGVDTGVTTGASATADTGAVGADAAGGGVMDLAAGVPGGLGTTHAARTAGVPGTGRVGVTNVAGDTDTRATAGADAGVAGAAGADTAAVNCGGCAWLSAAINSCPTSPVGTCARGRLALLVCNHWGSWLASGDNVVKYPIAPALKQLQYLYHICLTNKCDIEPRKTLLIFSCVPTIWRSLYEDRFIVRAKR